MRRLRTGRVRPLAGRLPAGVAAAPLALAVGPPAGADLPGVDLLYGAARLLAFAALAVLVGAALFVAAWWPQAGRHPAMRRLIWSSWAVLVGATGAVLLLFGPEAAARPLGAVLDARLLSATLETRMGTALLGRVLLLSLAAPALAVLLSRPAWGSPARRVGGVLGGAAALASTWSIAGHAAVGRQAVLAVVVDVGHLCAMSVWLGGLVVLSGVLLRTAQVEVMRSAVPAFSRAALICVAVLVGTGAYQSWREVGSPGALLSTSYGWLLTGKLLLVAALVGIGAASRSWVHRHYGAPVRDPALSPVPILVPKPRPERVSVPVPSAGPSAMPSAGPSAVPVAGPSAGPAARPAGLAGGRPRSGPGRAEIARFRRMVGVEAGLAAVVLGVTAALVTSQPARAEQLAAAAQQRAAQARAAAQAEATAQAEQWPTPVTARIGFAAGSSGQGVLDLVVFPAAVGNNQVHLSVLDRAGGLLDIPDLTATLTRPDLALDPLPVPLQKLGPGHYTGSMTIPRPGRWRLDFTVRTAEPGQGAAVSTPIDIR